MDVRAQRGGADARSCRFESHSCAWSCGGVGEGESERWVEGLVGRDRGVVFWQAGTAAGGDVVIVGGRGGGKEGIDGVRVIEWVRGAGDRERWWWRFALGAQ